MRAAAASRDHRACHPYVVLAKHNKQCVNGRDKVLPRAWLKPVRRQLSALHNTPGTLYFLRLRKELAGVRVACAELKVSPRLTGRWSKPDRGYRIARSNEGGIAGGLARKKNALPFRNRTRQSGMISQGENFHLTTLSWPNATAERRHHRPCRPWQDHPGRPAAATVGYIS